MLLSKEAAKSMLSWEPVSDRIITVRLRTRYTCATIIQVYTPTEASLDNDKLSSLLQSVSFSDDIPSYDLKILMGDLNAQIGQEANNRKSDRRKKPIIANFVDFTDWQYGRSLNSMEYQRRSLPLFRSYTRRAAVW